MDLVRKTTLLSLLGLLFFPAITGNATYYYALTPMRSSRAALPAQANIVLKLEAFTTSTVNAGSPVDNDAVSTWTDQSSNAASYTQSTTSQKPTFKTNQINGKPALLFANASDQKLTSSTGTLVSTGSGFTIVPVVKHTSFPVAYNYFFNAKGASTASSPSAGFSSNASFKDLFFGCDTTYTVSRWTTLNNINTAWRYVVIQYNGSGAATGSNYNALDGTSALTRAATSGNDGDNTVNIIGGYKSASSLYSWEGYIAAFYIWNKKLDSSELSQLATFMTQEFGL